MAVLVDQAPSEVMQPIQPSGAQADGVSEEHFCNLILALLPSEKPVVVVSFRLRRLQHNHRFVGSKRIFFHPEALQGLPHVLVQVSCVWEELHCRVEVEESFLKVLFLQQVQAPVRQTVDVFRLDLHSHLEVVLCLFILALAVEKGSKVVVGVKVVGLQPRRLLQVPHPNIAAIPVVDNDVPQPVVGLGILRRVADHRRVEVVSGAPVLVPHPRPTPVEQTYAHCNAPPHARESR
mmetsp:Transcript_36951/g.87446  ORF Transcript_36951/g.87446 Transcript_36951/m.87446 type:complete len:235 (-) Transcript_36951:601-1305(-)